MIRIREATLDDQNFILSTWLRGLRYGCDIFELIPDLVYYRDYKQVIEKILSKATIRVATLHDDPSVIIGYSVTNDDVLHWIYVKQHWRRLGFAKQLVPEVRHITHVTRIAQKIINGKQIEFNPFLI